MQVHPCTWSRANGNRRNEDRHFCIRPSYHPVAIVTLRAQVRDLGLDGFATVIALGGKEYRAMVRADFQGRTVNLQFPFAGLPMGKAMQAVLLALQAGSPAPLSLQVREVATL